MHANAALGWRTFESTTRPKSVVCVVVSLNLNLSYIVQVLRLLLDSPSAADIGSALQLCDSKLMRLKTTEADPPLIQEIK
jgi:hypothetical protein